MPEIALVIETNNLRGGDADAETTAASLARLLAHLRGSLDRVDELVVTHDGLPAPLLDAVQSAAGRPVDAVELPAGCGYYEAKNLGFDATGADIVVFADSDCWPEPGWLDALVAPFADPAVEVVAGRTTYRDDLLGIAATTIDFMYFDSPLGPSCTRNFYANNVAFRRKTFGLRRFPTDTPLYRGPCQLLGLRLLEDGIPVRFEPTAHTVHRFPDTLGELLRLRLLRGQDTTDFARALLGHLAPRSRAWLGDRSEGLDLRGLLAACAVIGGRHAFSQKTLGRQSMAPVRGARGLGARALITTISAIDAAGAIGRALGLFAGDRSEVVLSYHDDRDRLKRAA